MSEWNFKHENVHTKQRGRQTDWDGYKKYLDKAKQTLMKQQQQKPRVQPQHPLHTMASSWVLLASWVVFSLIRWLSTRLRFWLLSRSKWLILPTNSVFFYRKLHHCPESICRFWDQVKSRNSLFLQRKMWVPRTKNKDSVHMQKINT